MTIHSTDRLVASYRPLPGVVDELVDEHGELRTHWAHLGRALDAMGLDELARRRREAQRLLDDDGVTYNIYADGLGTSASWQLDPLPVLISSDEWAAIERGVIQRSELLNLVLSDLYGPRDLVRRGLLPPELVYAHPGFLRVCDGVRIPGTGQLFNAAFDLARRPGGQCCVLADRTQAPSGAGYALENRVVVSRIFPSLYRDAEVHRVAPFFRALRGSLQAVAPRPDHEARIVVMSPGPWSETAFEHAYLASYLGYSVVEGADLTVRDGKVWLRSLGRLEQVDVVLRRVDAWFCDPLALRPDSQLGVPGLVEAARLGNVTVVNTLGSGALENPGLLPFLPRLAEHLLGQPLRLSSAETWWCGDEKSRQHVLANLDRLVIKPTARGGTGPAAVFGAALSRREVEELSLAINARPHLWVGQEAVALPAAPTLTDQGLDARRAVLRAFTVARGESYVAMPGGLTRVAPTRGDSVVANQAGALSKDTWVLASEPESLTGFWLQGGRPITAVEPAGSMSARAAENLFWLGRYAERAEAVVRLLRAVHDRRTEFEHGRNPAGIACLHALLGALTHVTTTYPGFVGEGAGDRVDAPGPELRALEVDEHRPGTLAHSLRRLLDAAHAVRDQLSGDTWIVIGSLDRSIPRRDALVVDRRRGGQNSLSTVMTSLLALSGLAAESMVRDPGWHFMDAGRRVERAVQLASLLRATVTVERDTATDSLLLESVLTTGESIITYRRRYRSQAQLETALDLLLLDDGNPRSLSYQLERLAEDLRAMPGAAPRGRLDDAQRLVLEAATAVKLADTGELSSTGDDGTRVQLDAFLARQIELLCMAADAIDSSRFTHLPPQRAMQGG